MSQVLIANIIITQVEFYKSLQHCYNVLTTLEHHNATMACQHCNNKQCYNANIATTLLQCHDSIATTFLQCYATKATTLQQCNDNIATPLSQCHANIAITLLQCLDNITTILLQCHTNITTTLPQYSYCNIMIIMLHVNSVSTWMTMTISYCPFTSQKNSHLLLEEIEGVLRKRGIKVYSWC